MKKMLLASAVLVAFGISGGLANAADSDYDQNVVVTSVIPVEAATAVATRAIEPGVNIKSTAGSATGIASAKFIGVDDIDVDQNVLVSAAGGYSKATTSVTADYVKGGGVVSGSGSGQLLGANATIEASADTTTNISSGAFGGQGSASIEVVGDN